MLEIKNLRHVYPNGYEALNTVSMRVEDGEVAAVIGRSGAGKSTLLRCINGLERPSEGSIAIDGEDIVGMSEQRVSDVQRGVGFIWQEYNLIDRLSVIQNVLAGRLGHRRNLSSLMFHFNRADRDIAVRSLERVNMLHRASHRADHLSGGEKQRVGIARAIAQEPKVLLADEPVASLDPELSEQVIADLAQVAREEGVPTLINLHDVELATEFCDKVIAVAEGTVVYEGAPSGLTDEVLNRTYRFDREWKSYSRGVTSGNRTGSPVEQQVAETLEALPSRVGSVN